jgi:hypothetical protein
MAFSSGTGSADAGAWVDVQLFVDGSVQGDMGGTYQRVAVRVSPFGPGQDFTNWSFGKVLSLAPGAHTLSVGAVAPPRTTEFITDLEVSGGAGSVAQGQLSALILNR